MMHHYTMCGLDYVYLRSGFRIHETDYGTGVSIERADGLDRAIAAVIVTSHARIRGQEVRFLRSLLGYSQTELANELGLKRLTVARWEGAATTPIQGTADRALRIIVARVLFADSKCVETVASLFTEINGQRTESLVMFYLPDEQDEQTEEPSLFPVENKTGGNWKGAEQAALG